jgi:hypothetical protein
VLRRTPIELHYQVDGPVLIQVRVTTTDLYQTQWYASVLVRTSEGGAVHLTRTESSYDEAVKAAERFIVHHFGAAPHRLPNKGAS